MPFRFSTLYLISFFCIANSALAQTPISLSSPNGQLTITFECAPGNATGPAAGNQLTYLVTFHGKSLITQSTLQLELQGEHPLGANVRITGQTPSQFDDTYRLVTGKASTVRNHYNALWIGTQEMSGQQRQLNIEARAYDDAIAFRYVVPEQRGLRDFRLAAENTEFRISKDAATWALVLPHFHTMYESEYLKLNASAFANPNGLSRKMLIGLPLLMQVPGVGWMAIAEADMRGYSAMYLENPGTGWGDHFFTSRLAPGDDPDVAVTGDLPHRSPWRVLLIGDTPGQLVDSNVITSLNPESAIADTSWIHAGLSSWDWWSGSIGSAGKSAFTTDTMKYYVDFAAKSGFPYMLIDAGWSAPNDITQMNGKVDVPEVVRYAAAKNVKVWIWLTYKLADAQMNEAFPLYEKWRVAGLKIDFVERDDQKGIEFYYRAAELAAKHHLMLDFHGATKPTGIDRTWPNILGYEAVLGMEQSKVGMRDNPDHRATLPFTRMLAGRMDYTPGGFENVTRDDFTARSTRPEVMGTRAQQLAMYVVYEAPFQMVSDTPKAYEDQPAFEFIRNCPATWDETHVLNGAPGEYIAVARRSGKAWFLGVLTNWDAREMPIPLQFLGAGKYVAEIYADSDDAAQYPKNVSIRKQVVDGTMTLTVKLAPGGGYAVRFVPQS
ncbi:MAG TPA: glycoside hydrolase family 97 protein [Bryobacteraceae bacterium]|jgi:alpha-glucosidase|nr:glycoside hydrolase family 97 protein [Bryobacteraceae bacterium]